jgi:uncharacterized iron-regulated protein
MIGICDEVANGKIADPFDGNDPTLEESQFSDNSLADFQNNIRSVKNAYLGGTEFGPTSGRGLSAWVLERDPALDARVRLEIDDAIEAIGAIPFPFRTAIGDPVAEDEIIAAQAAIETLMATLAGDVTSLVTQ